jgi:hypothetical protein
VKKIIYVEGTGHVPGIPADPDIEIEVTDDEAEELVRGGCYRYTTKADQAKLEKAVKAEAAEAEEAAEPAAEETDNE